MTDDTSPALEFNFFHTLMSESHEQLDPSMQNSTDISIARREDRGV